MITQDNIEKTNIDELMLAMDAVDTLRHEKSLVDIELTSDERKLALIQRLRTYYLDQGIAVSDETLETAVSNMDKNRLVHEPLKPGMARTVAHLWVDRHLILRNVGIAFVSMLAVGYVSFVFYNKFVVEPRERAAFELALDIETRLPAALNTAYANVVAAAEVNGDNLSVTLADNIYEATLKFIEAGNVAESRKEIARLEEMTASINAKIHVESLQKEAKEIAQEFRSKISDAPALQALNSALNELEHVASTGSQSDFEKEKKNLIELLQRVETRMDLRIVDRDGIRSGVWRTQDGGRNRVYYIIVEALDPAGKAVTWPIRNVENGKTEMVSHWGVRVPEEVYNKVGQDKQSDGIVDDAVAGIKRPGELNFEWTITTIQDQMITRW